MGQLTRADFEECRRALLRMQGLATIAGKEDFARMIAVWLTELETQRWLCTRSDVTPLGSAIVEGSPISIDGVRARVITL